MAAAVAFLIGSQVALADHANLPEGVTPVMATWLWGHHTIPASITNDGSPYWYAYPHTDAARIIDPPWTEVAAQHVKEGAKAPAVLFLHGCSGLIRGGVGYRILLMTEGYAVFEPDAYARPGHSCEGSSIAKRREEVAYALGQIRALPWVDQDRIVLMGFSEGGRTVGSWEEPGFAAHVILDAPATARAPAEVPVLAIAGAKDSYANPSSYKTQSRDGASKSILIAGADHGIFHLPEAKEAIRSFLRACCR
ncbi:MAG: dienelactone hydrolase family protein [Kiloniellales bacterium]